MKTYVHETVTRLLQLQQLDEQQELFQRTGQNSSDVQSCIASLRANLPISALMVHDRMLAKRKQCVAEVRNGVCKGCFIKQATGDVGALRRGELRRCGYCGRYLHLIQDEDEEAVGANPVGSAAGSR